MKLQTRQKNGETIFQLKPSIIDKINRYGGIVGIFLIFWIMTAIIFGFFGIIILLAEGSTPPEFLLFFILLGSPGLILLLLLLTVLGRLPKIFLTENNTKIITKRFLITPTQDDAILLRRKIKREKQVIRGKDRAGGGRRRSAGRRRRTFWANVVTWSIYHQHAQHKPELLISWRIRNGDAFDNLAETLAETLNISLIDETGKIQEIRQPGTTDEFVGTLVKEGRIEEYQQVELLKPPSVGGDFIQTESIDGGYRLRFLQEPEEYGRLLDVLKVVIGVAAVVIGLWLIMLGNLLIVLAPGIIVFGLIQLDRVRRSYIVNISPEEIDITHKGLFSRRKRRKVTSSSIERVIVFKDPPKGDSVELMSDQGRLTFNGRYSPENSRLLRNTFLTIFAEMANQKPSGS